MKSELKRHLPPLAAVFIIISLVWILNRVSFTNYLYLFFGLALGSFFLDIDHFVYWFYLNPNLEESRLAQIAFKKYDFPSLLKLLESTHQHHTSLVFHHFFFQIIMSLFSIFVFTSSGSIFGMAFLLSLNIHLLVDELNDFKNDKKHLQNWLFARESKQLPLKYLTYYLAIFSLLTFIFSLLLLKSRL